MYHHKHNYQYAYSYIKYILKGEEEKGETLV
jgi:hypothetical protein